MSAQPLDLLATFRMIRDALVEAGVRLISRPKCPAVVFLIGGDGG